MNVLKLNETNEFNAGQMKRFFLVEDSPFFKIINFNLDAGVTFPVHSHDLDGELSILVLEGKVFSSERTIWKFRPEKATSSAPRSGNHTVSGPLQK